MRPLLVGEDNPLGGCPRCPPEPWEPCGSCRSAPLWPNPVNSAGWRLCHKVLGISVHDYLRRFDRTNLVRGRWSTKAAREQAQLISAGPSRVLVLLGAKVSAAFGVDFAPFEWRENAPARGKLMVVLPHPSGLCRLWNVAGNYDRARQAVAEALDVWDDSVRTAERWEKLGW